MNANLILMHSNRLVGLEDCLDRQSQKILQDHYLYAT